MKVIILNQPSPETEKRVFRLLNKILSQKAVEIAKELEEVKKHA